MIEKLVGLTEVTVKSEQVISEFVDIDKRIIPNELKSESKIKSNPIDIDKRIESKKKGVEREKESLLSEYINEIKDVSPCKETLKDVKLNPSEIKMVSPEENRKMHLDFAKSKSKLIKAWETLNGREWPTYQADVYGKFGNVLRQKGSPLEAHHIKPICWGGENIAKNITPLDYNSHSLIHGIDSSYNKMNRLLKEI